MSSSTVLEGYRFLRTRDGLTCFAHVFVDVEHGPGSAEVVIDLPDHVDRDQGEVNAGSAPSWVSAALEGIKEGLHHATRVGVGAEIKRLRLVRLLGAFSDTTEDAVHCAAALATWKALQPERPMPAIVFEGGWKLAWNVTSS